VILSLERLASELEAQKIESRFQAIFFSADYQTGSEDQAAYHMDTRRSLREGKEAGE
jgi:hypothetical protein